MRVEVPFSIDMRFKANIVTGDMVAHDVVTKTLKHLKGVYDPSVYALFIKTADAPSPRALPPDERILILAKKSKDPSFLIRVSDN